MPAEMQRSRSPFKACAVMAMIGICRPVPPSNANNLSRRPRAVIPVCMEEPGRFRDATLVRIRQPDRTGGAALPGAHEKGRDLMLWCEFFRLAFPQWLRRSEPKRKKRRRGITRMRRSLRPYLEIEEKRGNWPDLHSAEQLDGMCSIRRR